MAGPTASGKTGAALAVAERMGAEIVSADSMQVYRGMDIGTAKATKDERARVPHHMIDIADPGEKYTAARFQQEGRAVIEDILQRGKLPLIVGGTGLYIDALLRGMNFAQTEGGGAARRHWEIYAEAHGTDALHAALAERDPATAGRLHPNDVKRVIRALEIFTQTGRPMSERAGTGPSPYEARVAGLLTDREDLIRRIDARVLQMMRDGLEEEARRLYKTDASTAKQALGYKELFMYFDGEISLEEAVRKVQTATRQYAKRQMTWFRRDPATRWFPAGDARLVDSLIEFYNNG